MITNYTGVSGSRVAYMIAAGLRNKHNAIIVVSNGRAAARLAEDLILYVPEANIILLPEEEDVQILYEARDRAFMIQRIKALQAFTRNTAQTHQLQTALSGIGTDGRAFFADKGAGLTIVIAPVSAAVRKTVTPERFRSTVTELSVGMQIDPAELRSRLVAAGYTASAVTESEGEFTSRGGILDVFPPASTNPVRIEFFDDEIDSIRLYDKDTQRSLENVKSVTIGPAAEFIPTNEEKQTAAGAVRREYDRRIRRAKSEHVDPAATDGRIEMLQHHKGRAMDLFEHGTNPRMFADFLDYFDVQKSFIWDYLSYGSSGSDGTLFIVDPARVEEALPESASPADLYEIYTSAASRFSHYNTSPASTQTDKTTHSDTSLSFDTPESTVTPLDLVVFTPFPERIKGADRIDRVVNVRSRQIAPFNGQIDLFAEEIGKLEKAGYSIFIAAASQERADRIREYLEIAETGASVTYLAGSLSAGFIMEDDKVCFISETDILPSGAHTKKTRARKRKRSADMISFSDLHTGDYIVHEAHGIGRFEGIRPVTADGQTRDYLVIRYAGSDVLYIPTEQLDVIQKYIGNSGNAPALSRLSGGSWKRTRERARRAIMEIAEDLVKLYAERQSVGGHAFGEDTLWQSEFEADFPYTETDDQLRATEEIKEDMERPLPMDRLLCGDVGYGKTEVAARAVFKCLAEGKQAAILAPTTLLVNQHYHNLRERFHNFPFVIAELSRFRSESQQRNTLKNLKSGNVDLVIGTHRLLSADVEFSDLGLLVIDEEQRFGVRHKEKIKQLRKSIDVLTLSATPIPRTLNMSLTGIKDISIIEEPPGDRFPVHTYVTPYEEEIMRNAIERELARGGQVFVVNNRITGINQIAETIERLVPDAVVAVGHGRMSEDTLESTMLDFIEGRTNVLVATTIIENGIDIPNANTMIILNADRFGLAQLYQLRGRVGRSTRLAYAYLMYQPGKVLTELARKRLTAIREFTEFGAGFKLAMRDLELRGAGNILGEAQSGHIESIGYELYCKEIDRAVRQLRGETVTDERADIQIELPLLASIPAAYISDESLKLQAYKRIAAITSQDDADDAVDELMDRYGDLPDETMTLIRVAEIRAHAQYLGAVNISRQGIRIRLRFAENNRLSPYALVTAMAEFGDKLTISSGRATVISLFTGKTLDPELLLTLMRLLRTAAENPPAE